MARDPAGSQKFLYRTVFGRICLKVLTRPAISKMAGSFMNSRLSRRMIPGFVQKNQIDLSEYEQADFSSYNAFFTRKIRPECRPVDPEDGHFISPCDAKLSVYPVDTDSVFYIKGSKYTLADLLGHKESAQKYAGGYCMIFRLTVDDYHRYCFLDRGYLKEKWEIPGILHTVQPIALEVCNIYKTNSRVVSILQTENFGEVVQVEVGAMMVGKIWNHPAKTFVRGQEKGMFLFGGSTIVVLTQRNRVAIDEEILQNTTEGAETIVKLGEKIGIHVEK